MQIICPSCQTKFITDAKEISDQGRRVRCSQCQYVWWHHNSPDHNAPQPQLIAQNLAHYIPAKKGSRLKYLYALIILLAGLGGAIALQTYQEATLVTGTALATPIKVGQVFTTYTPDTTTVQWHILNPTTCDQVSPALAVELIDAQGNVLKRHEINEKMIVEAGKNLILKVMFFNKGYQVEKVAVYANSHLEYLVH